MTVNPVIRGQYSKTCHTGARTGKSVIWGGGGGSIVKYVQDDLDACQVTYHCLGISNTNWSLKEREAVLSTGHWYMMAYYTLCV